MNNWEVYGWKILWRMNMSGREERFFTTEKEVFEKQFEALKKSNLINKIEATTIYQLKRG